MGELCGKEGEVGVALCGEKRVEGALGVEKGGVWGGGTVWEKRGWSGGCTW